MHRLLIKNYLLELKMKGSSGHTVSNYSYHLQKFTTFLEETQLNYSSLTPIQIKAFRNRLVEAGLKPKTVNAVLSALKSFYDYLVEEGELKNNPVDTGRLRVKEGQSLPGFMSTEELEVFLQWLSKTPAHVALAFRTLLATGLRLSEAAWLTPADIILLDNKRCVLRVRHGKGDKERYTPVMDPGVASELLRLKGNRLDHRPLFSLSTHSFKSWARKCRLKTGLPFHTHRCRHTVVPSCCKKASPWTRSRKYWDTLISQPPAATPKPPRMRSWIWPPGLTCLKKQGFDIFFKERPLIVNGTMQTHAPIV